ncbi:peptidoglycan-binding domain-containing protein [Isoptericola sp. b490]|uniref:peptidoglycan-binding domain-containing protein n=1 Tax=Actinotalea lenta TaxID=3064654 RepID=UPI002713051A|nr:peptidoglycan-binding protein [Isoptericola sp. b490]MDO8121864.1 peptidoglycan-binding domain-containing protein [Isoptericola sp. b490]
MAGSRASGGRGRRLVYGLSVVLGAVAAVGCAWLVTRDAPAGLTTLDPPSVAVTAPVVDVQMRFTSDATVTGHYATPPDVLSTGRGGVLTSVAVHQGSVLTTGSEVYRVDGFPVRAYASETVFFRPLPLKASGADVAAAQELLRVLVPDAGVEVDGVVGPRTVAAVKAYERAQGVGEPTGVFDPTWFVRIPSESYKVGSTHLVAGTSAPVLGEPVVSGAMQLATADLVPASSPLAGPDGAWVFACSGRQAPVTRSGQTWTFDDLPGLASLLGPAGTDGSDPSCTGSLQLADPQPGQGVPPASLVYSANGSTVCVLVRDSDGTTTPVALDEPQPSIDGLVVFGPTLAAGAQVVVNPAEAAPDVACP